MLVLCNQDEPQIIIKAFIKERCRRDSQRGDTMKMETEFRVMQDKTEPKCAGGLCQGKKTSDLKNCSDRKCYC